MQIRGIRINRCNKFDWKLYPKSDIIYIMRNKRVCDYIAEAIQNEILSGRMSSGVPLRQEELADSLGYSRIPIREALQILESQGLAKRLATRHVVVADFRTR